MYIPVTDLLFVLMLCLFLAIVYRRIIHSIDLFKPILQTFSRFDRNNRKNSYIKLVSRKPVDFQKAILKEGIILSAVFIIIALLGAKMVFFVAVVSGSMYPTFDRDDLVLMQNIDSSYKTGDIIMFIDPYSVRPYTHRIIGITKEGIFTAGDASGMMDGWRLKTEDILGKAVLINGKPIVIKEYGKFFIIDDRRENFGPLFGSDYRQYVLFFEIVKIYGYVIVVLSLMLYMALTAKQKPWKEK